jgi:hypothetical protein
LRRLCTSYPGAQPLPQWPDWQGTGLLEIRLSGEEFDELDAEGLAIMAAALSQTERNGTGSAGAAPTSLAKQYPGSPDFFAVFYRRSRDSACGISRRY